MSVHTRDEIIALAQKICGGTGDADTLSEYLNDVVEEVASFVVPPFLSFTIIEIDHTLGTHPVFDYPDNAIRLITLFYDDDMLMPTTLSMLEARSRSWRTLAGPSYAWVEEEETARKFRLVPSPTISSDEQSFTTGSPMGEDFPAFAITAFYADRKDRNFPKWAAFGIVFRLLWKEFSRPSDHRDDAFAVLCLKISNIFWFYVGVVSGGK